MKKRRNIKNAEARFEVRFWSKISPEPNSGCWLWMGCATFDGYGKSCFNGTHDYAHRVSYQFYVGKIPDGLHIDHLCRVPCCVNPAHLEPVTVKENVDRGRNGILRTHCRKGHPLTEDNIERNPLYPDRRTCKKCKGTKRSNSMTENAVTKREAYDLVRRTLLEILRRGSVVDTDDPRLIDLACAEQERIAKRIEKTIRPPRSS